MPLTYIPFCFPDIPTVNCAFTGRAFGNVSLDLVALGKDPALWDRTVQARESIEGMPGVSAFAEVHQVHGIRTVFEPEKQAPREPSGVEADGMATTRPGLALMVKTADCQPILIAHSSGRFVMALHSGWRGNRQDYPYIAVLEFCGHYGLEPAELSAVRGPSLGPSAAEFRNFDEEWGPEFLRWYDSTNRTMDLWMLARHQLERAGLRTERIFSLDLCTYENADEYFSYRQFRRNGLPDGRQASLIWIR